MHPRILILYASVGSGHGRAAQAVELAIREICPDACLRNIDVLDLANAAFRRIYSRSYFDLVARAPHMVGYLYDRLDQPLRAWERPIDKMRCALQGLSLQRLISLLTGSEWDLVINTHFLPAEIVAAFRRIGRIAIPQVTVTTDFDTHRLWHNPPCERYFTATEEGKANLAACGVDPMQISPTGIPIHPLFASPRDAWECKREFGLFDDRPVVLQMAGGLGTGPIERIHRELLEVRMPMQIVVVTGRNTIARQKLQALTVPSRHRRVILGFTDRIDELMGAANVILSKPGRLTTSEALSRGCAMAIVDPIPGQESRNSDYLLENGVAMKVNNLASLGMKLTGLLSEPSRLDGMRSAARKLAKPQAAYDVAHQCLRLLGLPKPQKPPVHRNRLFRRVRRLVSNGENGILTHRR